MSESEVAEILKVTTRTLINWRKIKKIPDYLYRNCGSARSPFYRYNRILLVRWSILPIADRPAEELWAIDAIANYGKN